MVHYMHLQKKPYESIKNGEKTIELRLYDEKRKLINIGDEIVFSSLEYEGGTIRVKVIAMHLYDSFEALYATLPVSLLGYSTEEAERASCKDMEMYYSKEQQSAYGVVGIEFTVIGK